MSLGTQALLLIRLDARSHEFVAVAEMAKYLQLPVEQVRVELQALWDQGYVQCEMRMEPGAPRPVISAAMASAAKGQPCA